MDKRSRSRRSEVSHATADVRVIASAPQHLSADANASREPAAPINVFAWKLGKQRLDHDVVAGAAVQHVVSLAC